MERNELLATVAGIASEADAGPLSVKIRGNCMEPAVADGAIVAVDRRRFYLPGDVLVFRTASDFVAHRMLGYVPADGAIGYLTKGDHCSRHDGIVPATRIIGRALTDVGWTTRLSAGLAFFAIISRRLVSSR